MDILKARADLDKLQAETMWLFAEIPKTRQAEQRWTPILTACALLAVGAGLATAGVVFAGLFLH